MRNWLIKLLGGVTKAHYTALQQYYLESITEWTAAVDRHNMHGAWEQEKQARKSRRYH